VASVDEMPRSARHLYNSAVAVAPARMPKRQIRWRSSRREEQKKDQGWKPRMGIPPPVTSVPDAHADLDERVCASRCVAPRLSNL